MSYIEPNGEKKMMQIMTCSSNMGKKTPVTEKKNLLDLFPLPLIVQLL